MTVGGRSLSTDSSLEVPACVYVSFRCVFVCLFMCVCIELGKTNTLVLYLNVVEQHLVILGVGRAKTSIEQIVCSETNRSIVMHAVPPPLSGKPFYFFIYSFVYIHSYSVLKSYKVFGNALSIRRENIYVYQYRYSEYRAAVWGPWQTHDTLVTDNF